MLLKIITAAAATVVLGGAAAAQQQSYDGLPPLNSGAPKAQLPPLQGAPVATTGAATNTGIGATEGMGDDSVKDALGREIDKMGKTSAPATLQPLGVAGDLGKDASTLAPNQILPGSGLTTYSGQSANWIPK